MLIQLFCNTFFFSSRRRHTRLRVIELPINTLARLSAPAPGWKVVKSRGGRAWYVDSTALWVDGVLRRESGLSDGKGKAVRECLERWACEGGANGVGGHARKMGVLHGQARFGRE